MTCKHTQEWAGIKQEKRVPWGRCGHLGHMLLMGSGPLYTHSLELSSCLTALDTISLLKTPKCMCAP